MLLLKIMSFEFCYNKITENVKLARNVWNLRTYRFLCLTHILGMQYVGQIHFYKKRTLMDMCN